jgi:hypothetical protein
MTRRGRAVAALAVSALAALTGSALGANTYSVERVSVSPSGEGTLSRPLAVSVDFRLSVGETDPAVRPAPVVAYELVGEGLVVSARPFPACSLRKLRRRRGVPLRCERARVGDGLARGAGGLAEDPALESSVPCNLRLGVYNTRRGLALRVDGEPPVPRSFKSRRPGCVVPIHTAIPVRLSQTAIEGLRSTQLRFTLPRLLLHPLDGWDGALRSVSVTLDRRQARVGGRRVGFYSSVGCAGGERSVSVTFVDEQGNSSLATRATRC